MSAIHREMLLKDPTRIHPSVTLTIVKIIESYGLDSQALLATLGVDIEADLAMDKRVVGSVHDAIWRLALKATKDDAIGIQFTQHFRLESLSGLGFCWAASHTLLDGFMRFSRYFSVISSAGKITINEEQEVIKVALVLPVPYGVAADQGVDAMLALLVHLSRLVQGDELCPLGVNLQRPKPTSYKAFDDFFKCKITYGAELNEVVFLKRDLLKISPTANPELVRANDQIVIDYIRQNNKENMTSKVASLIADELPLGTPSQPMIAEKLNISCKTLQRRLAAEKTNFSTLLDQIRSDLAAKYLMHEWRTVSEISYLLGFTEPSNFARWFKQDKGISPIEFRKKEKSNV